MSLIRILPLAALVVMAPAGALASETDVELAKKFYKLGAELYKRGDYKRALEQFKESHKYSKRPELLYNMGRCEEGLGHRGAAIKHYKAYLMSKPANAAEVSALVKRLEAKVKADEEAAKKKPQPEPEPEAKPGRPLRLAGWVLTGVGVAGLVAGGVLGGLAMGKQSEVEDDYKNKKLTYPEMQSELDAGEGMELGAIIGLAVGGAVAATGAVLLIIDSMGSGGEKQSAWIAPGFSADGAAFNAGFQF